MFSSLYPTWNSQVFHWESNLFSGSFWLKSQLKDYASPEFNQTKVEPMISGLWQNTSCHCNASDHTSITDFQYSNPGTQTSQVICSSSFSFIQNKMWTWICSSMYIYDVHIHNVPISRILAHVCLMDFLSRCNVHKLHKICAPTWVLVQTHVQ